MKITRYYGGDIKFIKTDNLRENRVSPPFAHYLSEEGNEIRKNSALKKGDIITTIIGATKEIVGRTSIIQKEILPANINQNIALIRVDHNKIIPNYLNIYLNTKFGRGLLYYHSRQTEQVNLNCREVERVLVPLFDDLQIVVSDLVLKIEQFKVHYKHLYSQAEKILLEEIGLLAFEPSHEPINIKSFQESFATSGRLDAEYYQKKYDDYIEVVQQYRGGSEKISVCCDMNIKNFKPDDKQVYKYIELSNIGKSGDINGCTVNLGKELPSRARRRVVTGDVIISSIEGSLESCALVTDEYHAALCSTGFYVLKSDKINSETLLVLFKSKLMQNILKQNCSGTILTAINKNEFFNIELPLIESSKQQQIADFIEQSFALKKESEHLLEVAKCAVEMAIEEDEGVALKYIDTENLL